MHVVRVVMKKDLGGGPWDADRFGVIIEQFQQAGHVTIHRDDDSEMCFDIKPPRDVQMSEAWAIHISSNMRMLGINAVSEPHWKHPDAVDWDAV